MLTSLETRTRTSAAGIELATLGLASLVMATLAQMQIPLWYTPVPITFGTLGPIVVGAALGPRRGALAVLLYLAEGAMGIPVFSGGSAGIAKLLGPTGGYLVGYIFAAAAAGFAVQRGWCNTFLGAYASLFAASGCFFLFGLPWLAFYVGANNVLEMGLYPFLVGDLIKTFFCASYVVGRRRFG